MHQAERVGQNMPTDSVDPSQLVRWGGIEITTTPQKWQELADQYAIPVSEIQYIDFNRSGVQLPSNEVKVSYRARFIAAVGSGEKTNTWFALPVRAEDETNFTATEGQLKFRDILLAQIGTIFLDTCDVSYQRGPHLLNLNSRSRGSCGGCTACVHNYKDLYDATVLKDKNRLSTPRDIKAFFDEKEAKGLDIASLKQIAVVTGLFGNERSVVEHIQAIAGIVKPRGFQGEFMYFGCEVNSDNALRKLSELGEFTLIYAIDNFTKRQELLARKKSSISVSTAYDTLERATKYGISTTFAYIAGIDSLEAMEGGFKTLRSAISRFPIVNIFQVQTPGQLLAMDPQAKKLDYYLKARTIVEKTLGQTGLKPKRWENYRPLWYEMYNNKSLPHNAFGD